MEKRSNVTSIISGARFLASFLESTFCGSSNFKNAALRIFMFSRTSNWKSTRRGDAEKADAITKRTRNCTSGFRQHGFESSAAATRGICRQAALGRPSKRKMARNATAQNTLASLSKKKFPRNSRTLGNFGVVRGTSNRLRCTNFPAMNRNSDGCSIKTCGRRQPEN